MAMRDQWSTEKEQEFKKARESLQEDMLVKIEVSLRWTSGKPAFRSSSGYSWPLEGLWVEKYVPSKLDFCTMENSCTEC